MIVKLVIHSQLFLGYELFLIKKLFYYITKRYLIIIFAFTIQIL
jgi:hypothetical protein